MLARQNQIQSERAFLFSRSEKIQWCRHEGEQAFDTGQSIDCCPYDPGQKNSAFDTVNPEREWIKGWINAKDRAAFSLSRR